MIRILPYLLALVTLSAGAQTVDEHQQQIDQYRKQQEALKAQVEIARLTQQLEQFSATPESPTGVEFPRLVRVLRLGRVAEGEFRVGRSLVRARPGQAITSNWRVERFETGAAILSDPDGQMHRVVLGVPEQGAALKRLENASASQPQPQTNPEPQRTP